MKRSYGQRARFLSWFFFQSGRENHVEAPSVLLLLLLLLVDLARSGTLTNTGDSFKSRTDVDN